MDSDDFILPLYFIGGVLVVCLIFFGIIHAATGYTTPDKVFNACNTTGYWQYEQKRIKCTIEKN